MTDEIKYATNYANDFRLLIDRVGRTIDARYKRGETRYISRINNPYVDECYVANISGDKDNFTLIIKYDNVYVFSTDFYNQTIGKIVPSINILTKHFLEQYRGRNNLYSTPTKDFLYNVITSIGGSISPSTDKFQRAAVMRNDCVAPITENLRIINGKEMIVSVFITCLNVKDRKVTKILNIAKAVEDEVDKVFGDTSY